MTEEEQTQKIIDIQNKLADIMEEEYSMEYCVALLRILSQLTYSEELYNIEDNRMGMVHILSNAFMKDVDGEIGKVPAYITITHDLSAVAEMAVVSGIDENPEGTFHAMSVGRENFNKSVAALTGLQYTSPTATDNVTKH